MVLPRQWHGLARLHLCRYEMAESAQGATPDEQCCLQVMSATNETGGRGASAELREQLLATSHSDCSGKPPKGLQVAAAVPPIDSPVDAAAGYLPAHTAASWGTSSAAQLHLIRATIVQELVTCKFRALLFDCYHKQL